MTKKGKNDLYYIVNGFIILIGLFIIFTYSFEWYYLFGLLIGSTIFTSLIIRYIPDRKTTKKTAFKKNTSKKQKSPHPKTSTKEHNLLRTDNEILILPLNKLTWREFERLCYLYYKGKGYKVKETKEGADGGIDLIYFDPENQTNVAVQIKQYSKPINVNIIRNLDSAKKNYKCILAEIITTSTYTQAAKDEADDRKIVWRDKSWVELFLLPWRDKEAQKRKLA